MIDLEKLSKLPEEQQKVLLDLLDDYQKTKSQEQSAEHFLFFAKEMWAAFIEGYHHKIMADAFDDEGDGCTPAIYILLSFIYKTKPYDLKLNPC